MPELSLTIINKLGLHARAAAKLVNTANAFDSEILISNGQRQVNAKSIMGVMMLAAAKDSKIIVNATGGDAEQALTALQDLVNQRFGEAQ